jgi:hypothetical protein
MNPYKKMKMNLEFMQESILNARPMLAHLMTDKSVTEYLRPALEWRMRQELFPYAELLRKHIVLEVQRLYGNTLSRVVHDQLESGWVIETGAHLHVPRKYDKVGMTQGQQINAAYFQGQVFWAFANHSLGRKVSISLSTGKVPLDNINSGAYLDLPSLKTSITLASKKKHPDSPQSLIPATNKEEILKKMEQIHMLKRQKLLTQKEYEFALLVLNNFLHIQSSFADQVATTHAFLMDRILPVKQITLDSEKIGIEFLAHVLEDSNSLLHKIFVDAQLREKFITSFAGILKGWPLGANPFYTIVQKEEGYRLVGYEGSLEPLALAKGLRTKTIFPSVIMKFFAMMVEAGISPNGAWTQAVYCTQTKEKAVAFLRELGLTERADVVAQIPTHISAASACFGMHEFQGKYELMDAISVLLDPFAYDIKSKLAISGRQAFLLATPFLYEYLLKEAGPLSYADLKEQVPSAVFETESEGSQVSFPSLLRYTYDR